MINSTYRPIRVTRRLAYSAAVLAVVLTGCAATGSTGSLIPSNGAPAEPGAASASPAATTPALEVPSDLGPAPTIDYPDVQALGVGTIVLTRPAVGPINFWVTCEWSTTDQVSWIYPRPAGVLGERVYPSLLVGPGPSFSLGREGEVASYYPTAATHEAVEHNADWTSATITFADLPLNPDLWTGPFPTPKASFERPLGGNPAAVSLDGTATWACGPRPATVPTPGPSVSPEPLPSFPFARLPDARIHVGDEVHVGKPGCGVSWEGYGSGGADSCGPSYQVLGDDAAVHGSVGDRLRFSLPAGFNFSAWSLAWVDQAAAEHYRGTQPPGMEGRDGARDIDQRTLSLDGLPAGDWSVLLVWSGTDGELKLSGQPDYFRVIIR
jgi:hypothetical protein